MVCVFCLELSPVQFDHLNDPAIREFLSHNPIYFLPITYLYQNIYVFYLFIFFKHVFFGVCVCVCYKG